jgi:predicted lipoprotein with Yx(FWY)xxD motif
MSFLKRAFPITFVLLIALIVAGCGSTTSSSNTSSPTPAATSQASSPTPVPTQNPSPIPSPTAASANVLLHTATAVVSGTSKIILTNVQGITLYYFTPDTQSTSACTGGCASLWPPLVSTVSGIPASSSTLSGKLSVVTDANGQQVEYNGHLLYTYSGDAAPGQTHGEGLFGKWFVATTDLK